MIGRLGLVAFNDPSRVEKHGANYFKTAYPNNISRATAEVRQGTLESSNVNAAESAGRLVALMRQFEMLQKAISIGGEMNRKATEEVAKI
jgi:flagellar basal body rod protein FlgG